MPEFIFPSIDIPTLAVSRSFMQLVLAGLVLWMGTRHNLRQAGHWWAAGFGLNSLGLFAFTMSLSELDHLLVILNHAGLTLGFACFLIGFWRFARADIIPWVLVLVLLPSAISLVWWEWLQPNARMRILFTATGQVIFLFALQHILGKVPRTEMETIYRLLRIVTLIYAAITIWAYGIASGLLPTDARLSDIGYHRTTFSISSMMFMLALAVSCLALQYALLSSRHADEARRDWLTRLLNRRGFFEAFENGKLPASSPRGTLIMLDADDFKEINDRYGHAIGDRVLQILAEILVRECGTEHLVARLGGEEFAVWLHHGNSASGMQLAERIRSTCEQTSLPVRNESVSFTVSAGVAEALPGESVNDLLARADRATYMAKAAGRNRVLLYSPEHESIHLVRKPGPGHA